MIDLAQELFEQSLKLLSQAEDGAWDFLEETQTVRAALIRQIEKQPTAQLKKTDSELISQLLQESRALEKKCELLVRQRRDSLTSEHGKVSRGKAMQKAYGFNGR